MKDKYNNFNELARAHQESVDFKIHTREILSDFAIIAPHGGRIEHGTSQISNAIAGEEHAYYCFEGLKDLSHDLHITSDKFDEPQALSIANLSKIVITIHGAYGKKPAVYFGGLHEDLKKSFITQLKNVAFDADHDPSPTRQGKGKNNICNRGKQKMGVQIEMTQGFRKSLFDKPDYNHTYWQPNERFFNFVGTIRNVLKEYSDSTSQIKT
jgi:phage replication-related protein YjqB (UPF0714/DUF867 family)